MVGTAANYTDVKETDWFYKDVQYVAENNLMNGVSPSAFSPDGLTTRGMIVTILWRLDGEESGNGKEFADVAKDAYYYHAVSWAAANNIVGGYDANTFGPNDTATREQIAAIMYRYASFKGADVTKTTSLSRYSDGGDISSYAVGPLEWANANNIISGVSESILSPKTYTTRCQVAAILRRFCTNILNQDVIPEEKPEEEKPVVKPVEKPEEEKPVVKPVEKPEENEPEDPAEEEIPATGPAIIVSDASAKAGDEVTVVVSVKNNPGILGMMLRIAYDETLCTLQSATNGSACNGVLDFIASKELMSGARFVWDGVEISDDQIKDGEILVLTFKVKENATGTCPITLSYSGDDIVDNDLNGVYPAIQNGKITIR